MKILLITPVHPLLKKNNLLSKYQTQSYWVKALKSLGHQINIFPLKSNQLKIVNQIKLKVILNKQKPNSIFFSAGMDKLTTLKNSLFFCGVPPKKLSSNERSIGKKAKAILVNDPIHQKQWQELTQARVINLPFSAVDPRVFKPSNQQRTIDFSFVGTLFRSRQVQLSKIVNQNIKIKIWGWIPPKTSLNSTLKPFYQGEAWGQKVINIYQQSKAALNLVPDHMADGGNLRTFEIPACKTLEFVDKINPNYYLPGKEVIQFKSSKDLKTKLGYFLSRPNQRKTIAKAGYIKTLNSHTFKHRFTKLIDIL